MHEYQTLAKIAVTARPAMTTAAPPAAKVGNITAHAATLEDVLRGAELPSAQVRFEHGESTM